MDHFDLSTFICGSGVFKLLRTRAIIEYTLGRHPFSYILHLLVALFVVRHHVTGHMSRRHHVTGHMPCRYHLTGHMSRRHHVTGHVPPPSEDTSVCAHNNTSLVNMT